eukprot:14802982-Ditylum_brightwellii.AAC.1
MELEDPQKAQQWSTVDLPEEILHYLTIQNRCYFGQAKGTPFTGEFNSKELDEVQKLFIQHCKLELVDKVISTKIIKAQRKEKAAKWRENTTTSPLGRQLGHFKALPRKFAVSPDTN